MNNNQISKYLSGDSSEQERNEIEKWLNQDPKNEEEYKEMKKIWEASEPKKYKPDVEKALHNISVNLPEQKPAKRTVEFYALRIAAVLVVGLGIFFIMSKPAKTIAISTHSNESPKEITLADGSIVTLNSSSTIIFPEKFKKNERKVSFEGEAYFKIAKNPSKPFVIESGESITRVLGTEFNLSTKTADSLIKITVTEGLVSFNLKKKETLEEVFVKAGEVGEINVQKGNITQKVNNELNYLAWKNGVLTFNDKPFGEAVKDISAFYRKNIVLTDSNLYNEILQARFDNVTFDEVLSSLELIMDVKIENSNHTVYFHKKL